MLSSATGDNPAPSLSARPVGAEDKGKGARFERMVLFSGTLARLLARGITTRAACGWGVVLCLATLGFIPACGRPGQEAAPSLQRVGFLSSNQRQPFFDAFGRGLREQGLTE